MTAEQAYQKELEFVIAKCWADGFRHSTELPDGAEVYAYTHHRGVAWGINDAEHGQNIRRGIRLEDGTDIAVM
jgi:hypothetical protein